MIKTSLSNILVLLNFLLAMFCDTKQVLIHSLLRDVLQNQALPVLIVFARASLLAYASIRMSLVFLSCTTTGRSPLRFSKSMSLSDLAFMPIWQWTETEINLAI